jgi:lactose/L-arabinose transport system substrate-binding protein
MIKKCLSLFTLAVCLLLLYGCGKAENSPKTASDSNEKITLNVWAWNIAAKGLALTVPSFEKAHPNVKVNIIDIGTDDLYDKLTVGFAANSGLPDVVQIESERIPSYVNNFPNGFWKMTKVADKYIKDFAPSQWVQSKINGEIYSLPWGPGPVVMFYRQDYFKKANIDPSSIKTWNDLIAAGEKIEKANSGVNLMSTFFTTDDSLFRILMNQLGTFYFNEKGEITINSPKAVEAMSLIKELKDKKLLINTDSVDSTVTAVKNGKIAVTVSGEWWGGFLKDQCPEQAGKWRVMRMPAFTKDGLRAANYGGSTLAIPAQSKSHELAWKFVKNALASVDNQMLMYKRYDLLPSYLPVFKDKRFATSNKYFGGEKSGAIAAQVVTEVKPAYYTDDYAETRQYSRTAQAKILLENANIKTELNEAAEAIANATGRKIAK